MLFTVSYQKYLSCDLASTIENVVELGHWQYGKADSYGILGTRHGVNLDPD